MEPIFCILMCQIINFPFKLFILNALELWQRDFLRQCWMPRIFILLLILAENGEEMRGLRRKVLNVKCVQASRWWRTHFFTSKESFFRNWKIKPPSPEWRCQNSFWLHSSFLLFIFYSLGRNNPTENPINNVSGQHFICQITCKDRTLKNSDSGILLDLFL